MLRIILTEISFNILVCDYYYYLLKFPLDILLEMKTATKQDVIVILILNKHNSI